MLLYPLRTDLVIIDLFPEGEVQLLHPGVELVLLRVLLDWSEVGQHAHKILKYGQIVGFSS